MPEKTRGMKVVIKEVLWNEQGRLMPAILGIEMS
jgi:hypothetical protein